METEYITYLISPVGRYVEWPGLREPTLKALTARGWRVLPEERWRKERQEERGPELGGAA